jgi:peptidoglycan-N-acetylglucosamine deacetylase
MRKKRSPNIILIVLLLLFCAVLLYVGNNLKTFWLQKNSALNLKETPPEKSIPLSQNSVTKPEIISLNKAISTTNNDIDETEAKITTQNQEITPKKITSIVSAARAQEWLLAMEKCQGIHKIHTKQKIVALSFDDGPSEKYTPEVLKILKEHNIHATFFMIGQNVERYPNLARDLLAEQNVIGNHTFTHINVAKNSADKVAQELEQNANTIYEATGAYPALFRPPYGTCSDLSRQVVTDAGYKTILWSVTTNDYDAKMTEPSLIQYDILRTTHPGAIIALHDGGGDRSKTVAALPKIIERLQQEGYTFVTVPELLQTQDYQIKVIDNKVSWGFEKADVANTPRYIDTIIIHSTYNASEENLFDLDGILKEHRKDNVAPHYLIDRAGVIYRLVADNNIALHTEKGGVQMPDGRKDVNNFSIGIELINTPTDQITTAQYDALAHLVHFLKIRYKISHILGHNQISLERRTDPWNLDWMRFNRELQTLQVQQQY